MGTPVPNRQIETTSAWSSEVKTYTLSPEEISRRYGPPRPRREDNPFRSKLMQAIKVSKSPEEAAELLGMTVGHFKQYLGGNNIFTKWDKPKEEVEAVKLSQDNEANTQSRSDLLREKMTKEQYQNFKNEGLNDRQVLARIGLSNYNSWLIHLSILKKEWGLSGLKGNQPKTKDEQLLEKQAAEAIGTFLERVGTLLTFARVNNICSDTIERDQHLHDDDDEIEWATPFKTTENPVVRIHGKGVSLNAHAIKEMVGITSVMVGVSKKGLLIFRRGEGPGCYAVGINESKIAKGSSAKIGGGALVKFLTERGVNPGKYPLVRNEEKDQWEAEVITL